MQKDGDSSSNAPHPTKTPPSPPPDKPHEQAPYAASDTYTDDEFVVIEWEEEDDEAERITDLTTSAELSSLSASADLSSSGEMPAGEQYHDTHLDSMKRDWYQVWLHDKTVEKNDSWGFSSTGASRTASPARGGAKA